MRQREVDEEQSKETGAIVQVTALDKEAYCENDGVVKREQVVLELASRRLGSHLAVYLLQ